MSASEFKLRVKNLLAERPKDSSGSGTSFPKDENNSLAVNGDALTSSPVSTSGSTLNMPNSTLALSLGEMTGALQASTLEISALTSNNNSLKEKCQFLSDQVDAMKQEIASLKSHIQSGESAQVSTLQKSHIQLVDRLVEDKNMLVQRCEGLMAELKESRQAGDRQVELLKEHYETQLKIAVDRKDATNQVSRATWEAAKLKEIRELTAKGLEPEISRILSASSDEKKALVSSFESQLNEKDAAIGLLTQDLKALKETLKQTSSMVATELETERAQLAQDAAAIVQAKAVIEKEQDELARERMALELERKRLEVANRSTLEALEKKLADQYAAQNARTLSELADQRRKLNVEMETQSTNYSLRIEQLERDHEKRVTESIARVEEDTRAATKLKAELAIDHLVSSIDESIKSELEQRANENRRVVSDVKNEIGTLKRELVSNSESLKSTMSDYCSLARFCASGFDEARLRMAETVARLADTRSGSDERARVQCAEIGQLKTLLDEAKSESKDTYSECMSVMTALEEKEKSLIERHTLERSQFTGKIMQLESANSTLLKRLEEALMKKTG